MFNKATARAEVERRLEAMCPREDKWVVLDEETIERPFGWIFFYNSEKFAKTGKAFSSLAGNGPVFVNRETEAVDFFGSSPPLAEILERYEAGL
jgi:hypothetical protein